MRYREPNIDVAIARRINIIPINSELYIIRISGVLWRQQCM